MLLCKLSVYTIVSEAPLCVNVASGVNRLSLKK